MAATVAAASTALPVVGAAPAGLNEAQALAWKRLQEARAEMAALPPLDPDYLFAERIYERRKEDV